VCGQLLVLDVQPCCSCSFILCYTTMSHCNIEIAEWIKWWWWRMIIVMVNMKNVSWCILPRHRGCLSMLMLSHCAVICVQLQIHRVVNTHANCKHISLWAKLLVAMIIVHWMEPSGELLIHCGNEYRLMSVRMHCMLTAQILSVSWKSCVRKRWRLEHSMQWCLVTGHTVVQVLCSWLRPLLPHPKNLQTSSSSTVLTYVPSTCLLVLRYMFHSLCKLSV